MISIVLVGTIIALVVATSVGDAHTGSSIEKPVPPIIDIAPLIRPEQHTREEKATVEHAILTASQTWGFFQVVNHGISKDLQEQLMEEMKIFFHSPQEVKYTIRRTENNSRGFADDELTKRLKDVKEIVDIGQVPYTDISPEALVNQALDGVNQWPAPEYTHLQRFRPVVEAYYAACLDLSRILTKALAAGIPCGNESYFENAFDHHSSFLRLNYYPVLTDGVDAGAAPPADSSSSSISGGSSAVTDDTAQLPRRLGVSRHTDAGALTVLLQDWNPEVTSGLEVYSGSKEDAGDGVWVPVKPVPDSLTINTGDMMQVWSNGVLKAPEHRVRPTMDPHRVRYSAPFFYNPNYDAIVTPLAVDCATAPTARNGGDSAVPEGTAVQVTTEGDVHEQTAAASRKRSTARYGAIRWGDYRNMRFAGDFKDVGEEVQIEHYQHPADAADEDGDQEL